MFRLLVSLLAWRFSIAYEHTGWSFKSINFDFENFVFRLVEKSVIFHLTNSATTHAVYHVALGSSIFVRL